MSLITILESKTIAECKENWYSHLLIQKGLVDKCFPWLKCTIVGDKLTGSGALKIAGVTYHVKISYSPFNERRFDRIYIKIDGEDIVHHEDIHVYSDLSLCLYHPIFDKPLFDVVTLIKMVPWISEWCVFYQEWKKYKVWLGKEIKH